LVAQNPTQIDTITELDDADREALLIERTKRWHHPKMLYFTIILNSIAAAIQGWDQTGMLTAENNFAVSRTEYSCTGSNGANLSFPDAFGIPDTDDTTCVKLGTCTPCSQLGTCEKNSWIIGFINSMPYITIALL